MKRAGKIALMIAGGVLGAVLVGPFLVPVPPLKNTVLPEQLADSDSHFLDVKGIKLHYKQQGEGERTLVLLHGFGASTFSWREVLMPLAETSTVVAFDRPGFGLTERPMPESWEAFNPYTPQAQPLLTVGLMDALDVDKAVLVGNSAGGTVSVLTALEYPERVQALILVDPAIYTHGRRSGLLHWLFNTPQMRHLGPLLARRIQDWGIEFGRSAWHDPDKIPDNFWEGYTKPLRADNWDRALWEMTRAREPSNLAARLDELQLPVLVITGDDDRIVPTEQSIRLAEELPDAELVVIPECGHIPQEECPEVWLAAVEDFLQRRLAE